MIYIWCCPRGVTRTITRWGEDPRHYPLNHQPTRRARVIELVDQFGGYGIAVNEEGDAWKFYDGDRFFNKPRY